MTYYVKRAIPIKATQWNENGDHPEDGTDTYIDVYGNKRLREGKVVRRYRRPDVDADRLCEHCHQRMTHHGWIDTLEGGHTVCPGDYIITGVQGEHYPCKPNIFHKTYDKLETGNIVECDHCWGRGTTSGSEPCADCGGTGEKLWEEE